MNILVVQNRMGMGDLVIFMPFIEAISKKYKVSLRTAAYIAAIDKVSRTYKYRDGSFTFQKNGQNT